MYGFRPLAGVRAAPCTCFRRSTTCWVGTPSSVRVSRLAWAPPFIPSTGGRGTQTERGEGWWWWHGTQTWVWRGRGGATFSSYDALTAANGACCEVFAPLQSAPCSADSFVLTRRLNSMQRFHHPCLHPVYTLSTETTYVRAIYVHIFHTCMLHTSKYE